MTTTSDATATLPLADRTILVTRARDQAGRFAALLEAAGAQVLLAPTIVIEPPATWDPLDRALTFSHEYAWVIFTSVNGVTMTRRRLELAGRGCEAFAASRLAAIGPATAEALRAWGRAPDLVPGEYVAEGLAERLRPLIRARDRVLLPRAAETRDLLVRELEAMGARVDEVAAYRTRAAAETPEGLRDALSRRTVSVVTFTSSSTVKNFAALWRPDELAGLMGGVPVACIGPVTAHTAAELGLETAIMPKEYTIPALVRAIVAHFEAQRS